MQDHDDNVIVTLLTSIDASLKELVKRSRAKAGKAVAEDSDLDGKYGDPIVKMMPRDWAGEDFKGRTLSATSPAFLDKLAEMFDYFGQKAERENKLTNAGKPVAPYNFSDAARCRGWAKRMRAGGWKPAAAAPAQASGFGADPYSGQSQGFGESHFEDDQM